MAAHECLSRCRPATYFLQGKASNKAAWASSAAALLRRPGWSRTYLITTSMTWPLGNDRPGAQICSIHINISAYPTALPKQYGRPPFLSSHSERKSFPGSKALFAAALTLVEANRAKRIKTALTTKCPASRLTSADYGVCRSCRNLIGLPTAKCRAPALN